MNALQPNKAAAKRAGQPAPGSPIFRKEAEPGVEAKGEIQTPTDIDDLIQAIESIRVPAVLGGCLMDITFGAGTNPLAIAPGLKALDPTVKLKTEFFTKGGGKKDNKSATVIDLSIKVNDYGGTIDLDALTADGEDIIIAVWKNKTQDVKNEILALGRLSEANAEKIKTAFAEKNTVRVRLDEEEYFGANYWTNDKGEFCLDSLTAAPPAAATGPEQEPEKKA